MKILQKSKYKDKIGKTFALTKYTYIFGKERMSRPKPTILIEVINKKTYKTDQVLYSDGIWAVYYKEHPFNLKTQNMLVQYPGPKYKKTSFANSGHAINLAKKLNIQFDTTDFTVVLLSKGHQVYPIQND